MKISFAARYSRQTELRGYRAQLLTMGHVVVSPWLDSIYEIDGEQFPMPVIDPAQVMVPSVPSALKQVRLEKLALDEFKAVISSDLLVAFTEPSEAGHGRGGADVELGIALASGKPVVIVGNRLNLFHWLADVQHFDNFQGVLEVLKSERLSGRRG